MSDKNLPSFKAGAKQSSGVRAASKAKASAAAPEAPAPSLGFRRIEEILDREQPADLQQALGSLADSLDAIVAGKVPGKDKGQAKRAKQAVVRTVELLAMLFQTKQRMLDDYVSFKDKNDEAKPKKGAQSAHKSSKGVR